LKTGAAESGVCAGRWEHEGLVPFRVRAGERAGSQRKKESRRELPA